MPENAAFLYNISPVDLLYDIHIHYKEQELQTTEAEIYQLQEELRLSDKAFMEELPKKKYKSGDLDKIAIFNSMHKFINSTDQFYQYIDDSGKVYLDTCKLEKEDLTQSGSTYAAILKMAEDAIGVDTSEMQSFAYRFIKPNVGTEFQFYFIEQRKSSSRNMEDKVYQVTVLQPYGELEITAKEIQSLTTITLMLPSDNPELLIGTVSNLQHICTQKQNLLFVCNVKILLQMTEDEDQTETVENVEKLQQGQNFHLEIIRTTNDLQDLKTSLSLIGNIVQDDSLIAFVNPNITVTRSFLERCILNSVVEKKAYFPIHIQLEPHITTSHLFSQDVLVEDQAGYWANAEYNAFCTFSKDIQSIGSLPSTVEDLQQDLFARNIDIVRTADPGLFKLWSVRMCSDTGMTEKECHRKHRYLNLR